MMVVLGKGHANALLVALISLATLVREARAVFPTAQIQFKNIKGHTWAAPADFGPDLPSSAHAPNLLLVEPIGDKDGCNPIVPASALNSGSAFALLVSRGNCSFATKALQAQGVGASLVVIHNSLEGTYFNRTAVEPKLDYECGNGAGWLPVVTEPKWSPSNDVAACSQNDKCASGRCLVTNTTDAGKGTQVCCAWDLYITMGGDLPTQPTIPAVYVTMKDSDALFTALSTSPASGLVVSVSERSKPGINISSFLIWAIGVFTVALAAWNSARNIKSSKEADGRETELMDRRGRDAGDDDEEVPALDLSIDRRGRNADNEEEEVPALDLSIGHTVGFIVTASCFLILLFYVDLNRVISVLYCISAGSAVANVAARPFFKAVLPRRFNNATVFNSERLEIFVSALDALSSFVGLGIGLWWLFVRHTASYAWVLQDIMGICLCVLFLTLVRFPNIRVATVLLSLAFFYDIFFVFLSPIFFHESVMIKVATGGAPKADATYCEKYPKDRDCQTREDLPMLLVLPRINDYLGGFTMLGLGDIILPGLLVAFAARYDRAIGIPLSRGYFRLMVLGYAIGLMLANLGVYLMQMGQPALLYLVPCTLGVFAVVSYREGTLKQMWNGPPVLTGRNVVEGVIGRGGGGGGAGGSPSGRTHQQLPQHHQHQLPTISVMSPNRSSNTSTAVGGVGGSATITAAATTTGGTGAVSHQSSVTEEDAPLLDI